MTRDGLIILVMVAALFVMYTGTPKRNIKTTFTGTAGAKPEQRYIIGTNEPDRLARATG